MKPGIPFRVLPDVALDDAREEGHFLVHVPEIVSCHDRVDFLSNLGPIMGSFAFSDEKPQEWEAYFGKHAFLAFPLMMSKKASAPETM